MPDEDWVDIGLLWRLMDESDGTIDGDRLAVLSYAEVFRRMTQPTEGA